jgi:hypothetical protein
MRVYTVNVREMAAYNVALEYELQDEVALSKSGLRR